MPPMRARENRVAEIFRLREKGSSEVDSVRFFETQNRQVIHENSAGDRYCVQTGVTLIVPLHDPVKFDPPPPVPPPITVPW
jgi:hypothetical protein